jgi:uncharacterized protein YjbJ (UPF0337 family)
MDENRIAGTARNVGGKAEEAFGRVSGNTKVEAEGAVNQLKGTAQDLYGQARDGARDMADTAQHHRAAALHCGRNRARSRLVVGPNASTAVSEGRPNHAQKLVKL